MIVTRDDHEEGRGALGGCSIVSRNRAITAAHVVREAISVSVGFYVGALEPRNLRRAEATFWQPFSAFDELNLLNDIAVLQFWTNAFPALNVIAISNAETVAAATAASLASYGFTGAGGAPSRTPLLAPHIVQACAAPLDALVTETHICAATTAPIVVCQGDNGSGLYTGTGAAARLIGVVSTLSTDCTTAAQTAFTALGDPWIQRFLVSQGVEPVA